MASHAKYGGLQVLLVACQIDESDDLWWPLTDCGPVQAASMAVRFVDHLPLLVETQNVIADATRPAALHLMFVAEQLLASESTTVVEFAVG